MEKKQNYVTWMQTVIVVIVYIKTGGIYIDTAKDVEAGFDTSNCELDSMLPKGKNKSLSP